MVVDDIITTSAIAPSEDASCRFELTVGSQMIVIIGGSLDPILALDDSSDAGVLILSSTRISICEPENVGC